MNQSQQNKEILPDEMCLVVMSTEAFMLHTTVSMSVCLSALHAWYACTDVRVFTCLRLFAVCMYLSMSMCMCSMCMYMKVYVYTCIRTYTYVYVRIYVYVCTHFCTYIYISVDLFTNNIKQININK